MGSCRSVKITKGQEAAAVPTTNIRQSLVGICRVVARGRCGALTSRRRKSKFFQVRLAGHRDGDRRHASLSKELGRRPYRNQIMEG
jgi:hypothetical protein